MEVAQRIKGLESAIFNEMEHYKKQVEARGVKVINLGVGSPDRPPAPHIIAALHRAIDNPVNYRYPLEGLPALHQALARWYRRRFGVELDPEHEVLVLMGSQDGLAHIALAYINPGDVALVPDPGYPIYAFSILLAGGEIYAMPLLAENNFLPDLASIPGEVARRARLMWLNYPNNPVAVSANREFFERVVDFARHYGILVCHDAAYAELAYDGFKPMSFLEVPGAKEVGVEFYSLSKTYNMAGCRIGFAVGNRHVLAALARIKSNIDYGVFRAVQEAGIAALEGPQDCVEETARTYQGRRDVLVDGLARYGWHIPKPNASMFVWAPLPAGYTSSRQFALELLERAGVLVIPGLAFGAMGEGYVRIALVQEEELLAEAVERIGRAFSFR
ncbi:LL-diaminopimelate aminotransferase [Desulfofundulus thermosubterraneus]|uniref:Aminotransferase n=1 Tax=Desulfofundulus thermosubterraneus DSM 16057 TaxID=1121432 RepID=A0A1M6B9D4_9FIRM|nr:LL-diaminopimelate aminotransferase [Desulfofundulus thermosubterraneus]SHI45351.1 LL-diaminopimelate aminotransferase apoenzyme [Desulfofundulus thermosubterraneus DSM 16057]